MSVHDLLTIGAGLAAVIIMILLARYGTRFTGLLHKHGQQQTLLSLRASLPIDARRRLSLIDCDGRRLLLLTGGTTDVMLGWLPAEERPGRGSPP
ncbi:flagellar biosynthetic protein FliO [Lichenicoccus sp.]|uniref:flagellar biosynthetic protein FliO n=1 Tax=Lichenicoccus sp. TaxID=2781899 RepID=UPI003D0B84EC